MSRLRTKLVWDSSSLFHRRMPAIGYRSATRRRSAFFPCEPLRVTNRPSTHPVEGRSVTVRAVARRGLLAALCWAVVPPLLGCRRNVRLSAVAGGTGELAIGGALLGHALVLQGLARLLAFTWLASTAWRELLSAGGRRVRSIQTEERSRGWTDEWPESEVTEVGRGARRAS
jgi:hypothetical protein